MVDSREALPEDLLLMIDDRISWMAKEREKRIARPLACSGRVSRVGHGAPLTNLIGMERREKVLDGRFAL